MIQREISKKIENHLLQHKILLLKGSSYSGMSELVKASIPNSERMLLIDASKQKINKKLEVLSVESLTQLFQGKSFIVLDNAHALKNIQQLIELVLFEDFDINLICICKFEPELEDVLEEALMSQNLILSVDPPSFQELANYLGIVKFEKTLENRLIYGNFEQVLKNPNRANDFLFQYVQAVVFGHLSMNERINKQDQLKRMIRYLAFHIGEDLSYNEIGTKAGLDNETVERYVNLLVKARVLIRIPVYYTGQKYELKKANCFYFYDNGVRNSIVNNFNEFELRDDANALWKNWLIAEKVKKNNNRLEKSSFYFWKTHTKQVVDFLELKQQTLYAFQMNWDKQEKSKFPLSFSTAYPNAFTYKINRSTYWSFLSKE